MVTQTTKRCNHKDGWILKEEIVINEFRDNDYIIAEFECNVIGCGKRKNFKFDVENIKVVKKLKNGKNKF